ncbi:MAG TPA: ABC transporter permease [bacterium]|nr:ABC transporter permease [bacterium]
MATPPTFHPASRPSDHSAVAARLGTRPLRHAALRNQNVLLGGGVVAVILAVALAAPLIARHDPLALDVAGHLRPPSPEYPMGTDYVGRDLFARVLYGGRLSMLVGAGVVTLATVPGSILGLTAGTIPRLDPWIMRTMDALLALPAILLAIAMLAVVGPSVSNVIVALAISSTPRMARLVRGSALVARTLTFVEAARAIGAHEAVIMARHILPNVISPIIVQATYTFSTAVLAEAALSFLGVGAPPEVPSWGNILSEGRALLGQAPWMTLFPGAAIVLVVLGANLLGDGLRDVLDPQLRGE